ncbi:phosphatidylethanolamine-binding protein [Chlamydoabsidia padenii]|nr:phosphatidylethanolamine-binding protein [Chlamydoabsidia padenii]
MLSPFIPSPRLLLFFYFTLLFYSQYMPNASTLKFPEKKATHKLQKAGIIPNLVDKNFSPKSLLSVYYGDQPMKIGSFLSTKQTANPPRIQFAPADDAHYTLMMIDPDAPTMANPGLSPWRHWVVVNIPGNQQDLAKAASTQLSTYIGPAPPPNTGNHRYIFLLYKQTDKNHSFPPLPEPFKERSHFDYKQYAITNQLQLVSVNFFYAKHA